VDQDPGLTGNLLVERLGGAHVDLVKKEEYVIGFLSVDNQFATGLCSYHL